MGYTTEFKGKLTISPPLPPALVEYINKLGGTRRMQRTLPSHFGIDGEFFVDGDGLFGQGRDATIVNFNSPPSTQPGLWMQWEVSEDGQFLYWNGGEKFYHYVEWLVYLYRTILLPLGHTLDGIIQWRGEDFDDAGKIIVDGKFITADGYEGVNCEPGKGPRFLEYWVSREQPTITEVVETLETKEMRVKRLVDKLFDIADRVQGRSHAMAANIRDIATQFREEMK